MSKLNDDEGTKEEEQNIMVVKIYIYIYIEKLAYLVMHSTISKFRASLFTFQNITMLLNCRALFL